MDATWADPVAVIESCFEKGWTDGLPVVPPTDARVEEFLDYVGRPGEEVLGEVPERRRVVTVEKVAANAVMAGCLPAYFPVVLAAVEAMLAAEFHVLAPSASLGGSAILVVVNGPAVPALNINCRHNLFGPGWRANATIGRAIRLILMNVCGAIPGVFDRSTFGHPGKYTYCIGEDEEHSPWPPLHAERGLAAHESAVTVFACEGPRQVRNFLSRTPEGLLTAIVDTVACLGTSMATSGSVADASDRPRQGELALVIGGEHRQIFAAHGWSKADIRAAVRERARRSLADLKRGGMVRGEVAPGDAERVFPLIARAEDILVVAAGGEVGAMSIVIPSWAPPVISRSVTRAVRPASGGPH